MTTLSPPTARTKTEAAFIALRRAIEDGAIAPGARLLVRGLVDELGMSPTPIREALRLLQAEGLVRHTPHHGMVVAEYSEQDIAEVSMMRALLEPHAVLLAVPRAGDAQLVAMHDAHRAHRDAVWGDGPGHPAALNAAWHRSVYRPCGSRLLIESIDRLWSIVPAETIWRSDRAHDSFKQHERIMDAIERRDAPRAAALMREHIDYGTADTLAQLRGRQG